MEVLSLPSGQPGQWTLVEIHDLPSEVITSACLFQKQLLISCELFCMEVMWFIWPFLSYVSFMLFFAR